MKRRWAVKEHHRNIHVVTIDLPRVGDEQAILCQSDVHWDNPHCRRDLLTEHLDEAKDRDAVVLNNGDWFCAMQGKWDKRANKNDLRPEHQRADYLDALVSTSAKFLKPYQDHFALLGQGNHETSILSHHETNISDRLVQALKLQGSSVAHLGGYSGFVVFSVKHAGRGRSFKMHYHHGPNAGGAVTKGVIGSARQAAYLTDADLVWSGHSHDSWQLPLARIRLNNDNTAVCHERQVHFRTAGYKEEYGDGYGGYHIEKGRPPKPVSAAWLVFRVKKSGVIDYDLIEAK